MIQFNNSTIFDTKYSPKNTTERSKVCHRRALSKHPLTAMNVRR